MLKRAELWDAAVLVQQSCALTSNPSLRQPLEALWQTARIAFDIEKRSTPWQWNRHRQLVAEAPDGQLVGFAELWAEDSASLGQTDVPTPQPCVFNLCVSSASRRRGVGIELLRRCEAECERFDQRSLFLSVRPCNAPAAQLYETYGFQALRNTSAPTLKEWQVRWKGAATPLVLMSKRIGSSTGHLLGPSGQPLPPLAPDFDELSVTLETVLAYDDVDAIVWFALLVGRNARFLSPIYYAAAAAVFTAVNLLVWTAQDGPWWLTA